MKPFAPNIQAVPYHTANLMRIIIALDAALQNTSAEDQQRALVLLWQRERCTGAGWAYGGCARYGCSRGRPWAERRQAIITTIICDDHPCGMTM
jgi:hypothetical protein